MKKFSFRLERLLRLREFELERARIQLAELERERTRRATAVQDAAGRLETGRELLRTETEEGADGERLALRADGVTLGRMGLDQARQALQDLEPSLMTAREQVREARSRARSLERLREHRAEAHRIEGLAIEQAELEEVALARIVGTARSQDRANEESTP